jgi:hypothetical protein
MLIDGYRRTQDRGLGDYMNGCREEWSGGRLHSKKRRAISYNNAVQLCNTNINHKNHKKNPKCQSHGAFFAPLVGDQRNLRFKKLSATFVKLLVVQSVIAHLSLDVKESSELQPYALLPGAFLIAKSCTRCRRIIKGLSQVGVKADFSKNLRASPFDKDQLKDTTCN